MNEYLKTMNIDQNDNGKTIFIKKKLFYNGMH